MKPTFSALLGLALLCAGQAKSAAVTFAASGNTAADVTPEVTSFRNALGTLNGNLPQNFAGGRREINWDGVPEAVSSPNAFPGNFFNGNTPGRARGAVFTTPGRGFENSANAGSGVQFGNLDPSYPSIFEPFSGGKIFTPIGSNVMDVTFFSPADQSTVATVSGFGAVFTDVQFANTTSLEFFNLQGSSLGTFYAPAVAGDDESFSFLGVQFNAGERVGRVRMTLGNTALGGGITNSSTLDPVAVDDLIYAEPSPVPEPGTWMLLTSGAGVLYFVRRRR